jgi:protoporphyrinogen oxidase
MLFPRNRGPTIHAETFNYPRFGSGQFCDRLAELVVENGGAIRYDASVTRLVMTEGSRRVVSIQLEAAETISVRPEDVVVTTVPVSFLSRIIDPAPPTAVTEAASQLKTRPLVLLYLILNRPSVSKDNWLFFPEAKYIFNRVFEQKNFSPFMCPQDKTVLCLEIVAPDMDLWRASETDLFERAITGLEETGLVHRSQVIEYFSRRLKWAYPVYDLDYRRNTETVLQYLDSIPNLYSVGRQGGFNYVGQIDCLDIGILTAEHILHHRQAQDAAVHWADARQRFANYIVLD